MPRVGKTKSSTEPKAITFIPKTQLSHQDCPSAAGELTTANADIDFKFPPNPPASPKNSSNLIYYLKSGKLACSQSKCSLYCENNHCYFQCPLANAWYYIACTNAIIHASYIKLHIATTFTCALGVQYIIFSWVTNFPYLPPLGKMAILNDSH